MIEVRGLSHSLGGNQVLTNVNFKLCENSVTGLVGINGAGKSTLLRLMSGVYVPDAGEVLCDGKDVRIGETRKNIFFLSDDPYFTIKTTGYSLFEMYKMIYPGIDYAIFRKFTDEFKLDREKPIRNFSKGMRRQLYVALALAVKPKYLFLDEAFDGLDPLSRLTFKRAISESVEENSMGVLISSHSLRELEDFCDSYALIDHKTVASSGDIAEKVGSFCKFQLAYGRDVSEEIFKGLPVSTFEKSGHFFRVVLEGDKAEMEAALKKTDPLIIEEMPMDFEETFIQEVEKRGYLK